MGWRRLAMASAAGVLVAAGGGGVAWAAPAAIRDPQRPAGLQDAAAVSSPAATPARARALTSAVPGTPFVTSVVGEGLGLLVSWDPDPAAEQVTSYAVTVIPAAGGATPPAGCAGPFRLSVGGSSSAGLIDGLCTGVAYQAAVSAVNAAGSSAASAASAPVVALAAQVPEEPLITSVFARNGALQVFWTAPGDDGGKPLTGYTLTAAAGESKVTVTPGASAASATISGLTDGTAYSLSLTASNSAGASPAAAGTGTPAPAHVPAGPGQVTAAPCGTGAITVSWAAPADDGGDALTGFAITWQQVVPPRPGAGTCPRPGPARRPRPPQRRLSPSPSRPATSGRQRRCTRSR